MAAKSQWVKLGEDILGGKKIKQITLQGKTYKFDYSKEEFLETALKSGWEVEFATKCAEEYEKAKVDGYSIQSRFICDFTSDFCLNSGGFGCLAGDTKIYTDKGEITIKELYDKRIAPKVLSKDGKWSQATIPFKYEKAQLFKVNYGDKEVIGTAKHRFWTKRGWVKLSDLHVGEELLGYLPSPQESLSDNYLSILLLSGFHLLQRVLGSLAYYRSLFYSYGGRLLSGLGIYPSLLPSQVGVLGHNHQSYSMGGHSSLQGYNHAYQQSSLLSKSNFGNLSPFSQSLPVSNEASYSGVLASEHISEKVQSKQKSLWNFFSRHTKESINLSSFFSSYPYPTMNKYTVQSISPYAVDYYYDLHVFGTNNYLAEGVFHHNSGKSTALYIKLILLSKCFPGNRVLLGRKTLSDIDRAVLPELFALMPASWYEHRVKDGLINFNNGSQIILFGLDAMQSGGVADIKKAQQKLKSLNLGHYFIDQLEEVEYDVFEVLNSRLRRTEVPFRQGNMDCNPANFWAYHQFKQKQKWNGEGWTDDASSTSALYESSMLHNPNLPWDYIRKQIGMGDDYVRRFVRGEWTTDVLLKGSVFAKENIQWLETMRKVPLEVVEGCEIYEQPKNGMEYRMGVDPSEGVVDPSSISVVSFDGKKVAKFNGKVPIQGLADKVKFLYYKYYKPLIIPESNSAGTALIREIRDLRVYRRRQLEYKTDIETEKLGFRMSWESKSQLIDHFQKLLRHKSVKIYDTKTIEEMKSFMWSNEATHQGAGAARGFHDDDIISTLLAYWDYSPKKVEQFRASASIPIVTRKPQYI